MKLLFAIALISIGAPVFLFAQKDKNDKKPEKAWPVTIRTNLMVLDPRGKFSDDVKETDVKIYENEVEQKITYFAKKEHVTNVAFVLDNTGSMRLQLKAVSGIARAINSNLRKDDEGLVIRFVSRDKITLEQPWTSQRTELQKTFENLHIESGQSAIIDALYLAGQKVIERSKSEKDTRFAIVLITDGEDRDSYYTSKDLFSLLAQSDLQIFTIGLERDLSPSGEGLLAKGPRLKAERFLKTLAIRTGGATYLFQKEYTSDDLIAAVKALVTELRSQYVIGYVSTDQTHGGKPRTLRIEIADGVNGEKRTGILRSSFEVPEN